MIAVDGQNSDKTRRSIARDRDQEQHRIHQDPPAIARRLGTRARLRALGDRLRVRRSGRRRAAWAGDQVRPDQNRSMAGADARAARCVRRARSVPSRSTQHAARIVGRRYCSMMAGVRKHCPRCIAQGDEEWECPVTRKIIHYARRAPPGRRRGRSYITGARLRACRQAGRQGAPLGPERRGS